jgi:hypothetical protein
MAGPIAMAAAGMLRNMGAEVELLVGTVPRLEPRMGGRQSDLNRPETRELPWRLRVREILPTVDALVDVHGYPIGDTIYPPGDVTVLILPGELGTFGRYMAGNLRTFGSYAVNEIGAHNFDDIILHDAVPAGIPAALVEFNESLGDSPAQALARSIFSSVMSLGMPGGV